MAHYFHLSLLSRENQLNLNMRRQANINIICGLLRSFYFSAVSNYLLSSDPSVTGCVSATALSNSSIKTKIRSSGKTLWSICHQLQSKENQHSYSVIPLWTSVCMSAFSDFYPFLICATKVRRECTALHKPCHPVLDNSKIQQLLLTPESQWEWVCDPSLEQLELEPERGHLCCYRIKEMF